MGAKYTNECFKLNKKLVDQKKNVLEVKNIFDKIKNKYLILSENYQRKLAIENLQVEESYKDICDDCSLEFEKGEEIIKHLFHKNCFNYRINENSRNAGYLLKDIGIIHEFHELCILNWVFTKNEKEIGLIEKSNLFVWLIFCLNTLDRIMQVEEL
uniref:C2H2-type domain-containing protein n=1 Tax=Meloidogyne incognita TaxID=6306 RepID=A0A914M8F8_MELIC